MGIIFMRGKPYTEKKYFEDLKGLLSKDCQSELNTLKREREAMEDRILQIHDELQFSEAEKSFVKVIRELAHLRTYRIDIINISNYYALSFLKHVAARLKVSYEDMLFLTPGEIEEALRGMAVTQLIETRKKGWGMIIHGDHLEILTERKYQLVKRVVLSWDYSGQDSVRGMSAYHGTVTGKAFVALSSGELENITNEDILIAPETTVDFEIAMRKARAIVTDRGGILSHAAIVSREMKKPCVVGTHFSTKVFKTGDLIEVDTHTGVVRIRKRAN
jgi:pyruvate,water dikinase